MQSEPAKEVHFNILNQHTKKIFKKWYYMLIKLSDMSCQEPFGQKSNKNLNYYTLHEFLFFFRSFLFWDNFIWNKFKYIWTYKNLSHKSTSPSDNAEYFFNMLGSCLGVTIKPYELWADWTKDKHLWMTTNHKKHISLTYHLVLGI